MLDKKGVLSEIEDRLKDIVLRCSAARGDDKVNREAAGGMTNDNQARRRKLLKMALKELRMLDEGDGDDASLSMEQPRLPDSQEEAVKVLQHRLGIR